MGSVQPPRSCVRPDSNRETSFDVILDVHRPPPSSLACSKRRTTTPSRSCAFPSSSPSRSSSHSTPGTSWPTSSASKQGTLHRSGRGRSRSKRSSATGPVRRVRSAAFRTASTVVRRPKEASTADLGTARACGRLEVRGAELTCRWRAWEASSTRSRCLVRVPTRPPQAALKRRRRLHSKTRLSTPPSRRTPGASLLSPSSLQRSRGGQADFSRGALRRQPFLRTSSDVVVEQVVTHPYNAHAA